MYKKALASEEKNYHDLLTSVSSISSSLEKFCSAVYYVLCELSDENEVIREQVMETMQHALHCTIQLCIVACEKNLEFLNLNIDGIMLTSLRGLLLSVAIIIDSVTFMKKNNLINEGNPDTHLGLGKNEINEALIYILHFGRPLLKSEEENGKELNPVVTENPKKSIKFSNSQSSLINFLISPNRNTIESPQPSRNTTKVELPPPKSSISVEDEDQILAINPDDYSVNNLPPALDPPPPLPVYKKECSVEEHKAYMIAKYEYETWENKLILYKIKLKQQIEEIKKRRGLS